MKENQSRKITCINCPIGCRISADIENYPASHDMQFIFSGNKCNKGIEFAKAELTSPVRSLTTTVKTAFHKKPVLPVKTSGEVPKEKIMEIIGKLSGIIITKRIGIGEIVYKNICGTDCDIIATSNMLKE